MTEREKKDISEKTALLIRAIERVYPSGRKLLVNNFLAGLAFGLGTTVGVSIFLAVFTFTLNQLKLIPVMQDVVKGLNIEEIIRDRR